MSSKATHDGTCQICGARQRLPGGLLSLHGYTVDWGEFNGTCDGAREQPFEESRERLGSYLVFLRREVERQEETVSRLQGPPTDLSGTHRLWGGEVVRGVFGLGTDKAGAPALILTDAAGTVYVLTGRGERVITPQQATERSREEARSNAAVRLSQLRRAVTVQQARYDRWEARPLLPLTGSEEDRAARPVTPKAPTKQQQAQERHRQKFRAQFHRDPIWPSHQTTNNNPALFSFSSLLYYLGQDEHGQSQMADERTHKAFMGAASRAMNMHGLPQFLRYLGEMLGTEVGWDERGREFLTPQGTQVHRLSDLTGSLAASLAVMKAGPADVPGYGAGEGQPVGNAEARAG